MSDRIQFLKQNHNASRIAEECENKYYCYYITNEIVEKVQEKNETAFELLFYCYVGVIYRLAYRMVKNELDADDCLQLVFSKLLNNIYSYNKNIASFYTWFMELATNVIINYCVRKNRHAKHIDSSTDATSCSFVPSNEEDLLFEMEIIELIGEFNYCIIYSHLIYKTSFADLAKKYNMSERTIRRVYDKNVDIIRANFSDRYVISSKRKK